MSTLANGAIDLKSLRIAGEPNKYITHITDGGITVHDAVNQNLNYVKIDSNGMEIFKSDLASEPQAVSIANFGETIRIGRLDSTRLTLTTNGLSLDGIGIQQSPINFLSLKQGELESTGGLKLNAGHGITSNTYIELIADVLKAAFSHSTLQINAHRQVRNEPIHVNATYNDGYTPGIDEETGIVILPPLQIDCETTLTKPIYFSDYIYMNNAKIIWGYDTNGVARSAIQVYNGSNNVVFGYGGYEGSLGNTNIYGNHINFTARGNINANQPLQVGGYKIITVETVDKDNISITANGYAEGTISITKTGYTPIGVLDMYINNASSSGSNSSFVSFYRSYISGTNYVYGVRSSTSSAAKVRIYAKILYVATAQSI